MHPARRPAAVRTTSSPAIRPDAMTLPRMLAASLAALAIWPAPLEAADVRLDLREGWAIESSAKVTAGGEAVSRPGFATAGWHRASVPTTVVSALVADGTFPDPYYGMNLRKIPGTTYKVGGNFSLTEMPADSPFAVPWWYRTEFTVPPEAAGRTLWLHLDGVNFRFDAWLNGRKIADAAKTAGAYRAHVIDVTGAAKPGPNALAVLVSAPKPTDLSITFVDWNPMPPDKLMGLYRPVSVTATGPVALRHPQVVTKLSPALDRAELTVKVLATNATSAPVTGTLRARAAGVAVQKDVTLAAREEREIVVTPQDAPALAIANPKLWWPAQYGEPALHDLELELVVAGATSDRSSARFGIREFTSELLPSGRVYEVNGRKILIRGAGWSSDLMLRYSPERYEQEIAYVKDMGLNTIRLEGKLEAEPFFDITDREGILVMPGWCCCDHWEQWDKWDAEDLPVATASLRDEALRLRGRASVFTWLNGSDGPPPAKVEQAYLDVLKETGFPNPVVSSATEKKAEVSGESGMKMRGPYEWVPPLYWYTDTKLGGAARLRHRDRPGPGAAAPGEPEALHPRGPALAHRRGLALPLRRRALQDARRLHEGHGRALRAVEGRRGVRAKGPGRRLRVAPRHARVLRREEVHGHRRHPVDAEQRLAGDDLAPVRLLPAAGRLVLRREEGGRAAARAVRLRRSLRRRGQQHAGGPGRPEGDRPRPRPRVEGALRADGARGRGTGRQRQGLPGPGAAGPDADVLPLPPARRRSGPYREPQRLLALDEEGRPRVGQVGVVLHPAHRSTPT